MNRTKLCLMLNTIRHELDGIEKEMEVAPPKGVIVRPFDRIKAVTGEATVMTMAAYERKSAEELRGGGVPYQYDTGRVDWSCSWALRHNGQPVIGYEDDV